ncbi:MAG: hypothetical protein VR64_14905 [Desulfatitalea sp. BRH_c12]|nr:MAG: hypothetical protein VR64_14905 [Desulfatitalea sp. BRH_c12]
MKKQSILRCLILCGTAMAALSAGGVMPAFAESPVTVHITEPSYDSQHVTGSAVVFACSVGNGSGEEIKEASLVWRSNLDGKLGTGAKFTTNLLSVGLHRITLDVSDQKGIVGSDTIKIKVTQSQAADGQTGGLGISTGDGEYVVNPFN